MPEPTSAPPVELDLEAIRRRTAEVEAIRERMRANGVEPVVTEYDRDRADLLAEVERLKGLLRIYDDALYGRSALAGSHAGPEPVKRIEGWARNCYLDELGDYTFHEAEPGSLHRAVRATLLIYGPDAAPHAGEEGRDDG